MHLSITGKTTDLSSRFLVANKPVFCWPHTFTIDGSENSLFLCGDGSIASEFAFETCKVKPVSGNPDGPISKYELLSQPCLTASSAEECNRKCRESVGAIAEEFLDTMSFDLDDCQVGCNAFQENATTRSTAKKKSVTQQKAFSRPMQHPNKSSEPKKISNGQVHKS